MSDEALKAELHKVHDLRRRQRRDRDMADAREVMKTPAGRRFVYGILDEARLYASCYVAGDPHGSTFNEGKQDIGLKVMKDIRRAAPESALQMQREHDSEAQQDFDVDAKLAQKHQQEA